MIFLHLTIIIFMPFNTFDVKHPKGIAIVVKGIGISI